jgi:tripartite-type tricarboxylate transporter receptor subunit TctC
MRKIGRRITHIDASNLLVAAVLVFSGAAGWAQDFPSRQITIIVPFPAGGGNDTFARLIGQKLSTAFGRAVIVDNRPGASGNIGAEAVVRSAPDGHTLLYAASPIATSNAFYGKLAFDPQRDLAPVSMTALIPLVLVTHPSLPVRSVKELLALAKSKPGALSYGSGGTGSSGHLATELLKLKTGIDANHVPYRGAAPAQTALLGGEVQFAFLVIPLVRGHLKSGKMRALGISTRTRSSVLPDVPTLQEEGIADYEALQWHGFFAPVKTPLPIVERLHGEIVKALAAPEMKGRFATEGAEIVGSAPKEFATFFQADVTKWTDVLRRSGAKLD